jgi:hypothetical protein
MAVYAALKLVCLLAIRVPSQYPNKKEPIVGTANMLSCVMTRFMKHKMI